ncbi:hypothetical protein MKW94_007678 [Papaver nudicaule]|uniref:RNA polymerase I-specific transcription initiation factor RRN3 n=1 Tax=Papaver nudicaule TaxID=74823 RepID=A0AA41S8N3_PAPNU|nr:hypothetical protein [Papaver nudicaule]
MDTEEETEYNDSQVAAHIRRILSRVPEGDTTDYDEMVGKLNQSGHLFPDDVASLVTCLKGLSGAVGCIDIVRHETLAQTIFGMSMWKYNPDVMDALMDLIIRLATSRGFLDSSLEMLVNNFVPHRSFINKMNNPRGIVKKEQVLDRVHSALINITKLMPLAPLTLCTILEKRMPPIFAKHEVMAIYVENMLRLDGGPIGEFLGDTVLLTVMDRLVDLDVEIDHRDFILLDESNDEPIFNMEYMDEDDLDDVYGYVNSFPGKLDSLMVLICQHLQSCAENGRLFEVFKTLLKSFYVTILKTHKLMFSQFVVFYACSLDPKCGLSFANMLSDTFTDNTGIALTRMCSVAYLASYLSRARFLKGPIIANTLQRLVDWCVEYCRSVDEEDKTLNPEAHKLFYSGCQAIMYVLCYRMWEMFDNPDLKSQIFGFPLQFIFRHPLDPLKVCLPSIVEEFLKPAKAASLITTSENFLFKNLLESDLSMAFGGVERLDMFFPFDPYLLRKGHRFIEPIFLRWSDVVNPPYDDDEEDYSAEEQLGDEAEDYLSDEEDMGMSLNDRDDLFPDDIEDSMIEMSLEGHRMTMPARIRPSTSPL